ncbi:exported hypothetical protein [Vibrio jasicida]|uniref:Uncharacterized protein n=1 Tax=Vibrio jasicida TaxID=766224 RepID=A0AAU9QXE1_9VIBR|nr:exported hypothetical protein [Vibrio jasicida]CAH1601904.1 exported hypothetical protein [Vibrio jasicida]
MKLKKTAFLALLTTFLLNPLCSATNEQKNESELVTIASNGTEPKEALTEISRLQKQLESQARTMTDLAFQLERLQAQAETSGENTNGELSTTKDLYQREVKTSIDTPTEITKDNPKLDNFKSLVGVDSKDDSKPDARIADTDEKQEPKMNKWLARLILAIVFLSILALMWNVVSSLVTSLIDSFTTSVAWFLVITAITALPISIFIDNYWVLALWIAAGIGVKAMGFDDTPSFTSRRLSRTNSQLVNGAGSFNGLYFSPDNRRVYTNNETAMRETLNTVRAEPSNTRPLNQDVEAAEQKTTPVCEMSTSLTQRKTINRKINLD